jgi:hypothetical protein
LRSGRFLDFRRTELAARKAGKPIGAYLEELWNCVGQAEKISRWMQEIGCYEIYETAHRWAEWLESSNRPQVIAQPASGWSLDATPSASCELVHAHGVFVYLNPLTCFDYFQEMIRVVSPAGYIVFDFFPSENFDERTISAWLGSKDRFATILPRQVVTNYFRRRGFVLIATCHRRVAAGRAKYLAFRNV